MSNKMFKTKYAASVENDNLPVLGEMKLEVISEGGGLQIRAASGTTIKVTTDNSVSGSVDNRATYTSGTSFGQSTYICIKDIPINTTIRVSPKYNIGAIVTADEGTKKTNISGNLADLKYSEAYSLEMSELSKVDDNFSGDISNLSNLTSLTNLQLTQTNVSGDISNLSNLTSLTDLWLTQTNVSGDISNLSNLTSLTNLQLTQTNVSGDISNLSNLTSLTDLRLGGVPNMTGDISSLASLTNLTFLQLNNNNSVVKNKFTGDLTVLASALTKLKSLIISNNQFNNQAAAIETFTANGCTVTVL